MSVEVDVWVRGTLHAETYQIESLPLDPAEWNEGDVRRLLSEMLIALDREKNPGGERPRVSLRGFSWIVSPYAGGVLIHLETQSGTASAGPLAIDEARLTAMLARVMATADRPEVIH
jgi:hypothetical protein